MGCARISTTRAVWRIPTPGSTPIAEVRQGHDALGGHEPIELVRYRRGPGGKAGPSSGLSPCAGAQSPSPALTGVCRAFCAIFEKAAPSMLHGKRGVNPNERTRRHVAGALGYVDPAYLEGPMQLLRVLKEVSYDWMQLERGRVLGLGCGPARTCALAERSAATGWWVGIGPRSGW
jgi:hypothetical protein